ncbi:MAG: hypothetical protein ABSH47_18315 [Bryobacteraceae bacterium]|jgi:hypothetical protein
MITRALILGLVLLLGMAARGDAQSAGRRRGRSTDQSSANSSTAGLEAVFTGTVTSVTKSDLGIQADGGNVLSFSILHKTRFLKDGKTVKRSDVHAGDTVTIHAGEDPTGHPAAITVTVGKPTPEKNPQPSN